MTNSIQNVKKGILQRQKLAAKKKQAAKICNCRSTNTTFHNAECLEAVLMHIPWLCPVHGVRQLCRFVEIASQNLLRYRGGGADSGYLAGGDDNQFCPCPPHPWRTHVWKGLYRTDRRTDAERWAESDAAQKAWANLPRKPVISPEEWKRQREEKNRRVHAVIERYVEAVQQFNDSGRKSPDPREIFRRGGTGESKDVDG
jgi:hypothetical protein